MTKEKNADNFILKAKVLDHYVERYNGIVIYGIGEYGKSTVDYMIGIGAKNKIKGIVVTNKLDDEDEYEKIPICEAQVFFAKKENREQCVCGGGGIA